MGSTRIAVVHPHRVIADALAESLRADDVEVVGSTTSVRELVELARDGRPDVAAMLVQSINDFSRGRRVTASALTARQGEILQLIAYGLPNKRIARRLGIGVETVKTHVSRIMEKLDAGTRTEVVARAVREGILSPAMLGEDPDRASQGDGVLGAG